MTCYASITTTPEESEILLTKPRNIWVGDGEVCQFDVMTSGCSTSIWITIGEQCILASNGSKCIPLDYHIVRESCRGSTYTLTYNVTFNNQYFRDSTTDQEIAYFINQNMIARNFTAHVHLKNEPKVENTPVTTMDPDIKNCTCTSSANSIYGSKSTFLLILLVIATFITNF